MNYDKSYRIIDENKIQKSNFSHFDSKYNGRINIQEENKHDSMNGTPFFLQDKVVNVQNTNFENYRHNQLHEKNVLEQAFFLPKNIMTIQNSIKAGVYVKSQNKYIISPQDQDTLYVIMRSIFLSNSMNMNNSYKEQLSALNQLVVDYCVPKIYAEIQSYMKYKRDVSQIPVPMQNPVSTNYRNESLEFKSFF